MEQQLETTQTLPRKRPQLPAQKPLLWSPLSDSFHALPKGEFTLGKAPECHISLSHPTVSRHHASARLEAGALLLRDTGSRNGILFRGQRRERVRLKAGEVARLGSLPIVLLEAPPKLTRGGAMITRAAALSALMEDMKIMAAGKISILINGESGTGKELAARLIHEHSERREGPFFTINCGAIPKDLIESELFGHMRGAFSGASQRREGILSQASGGTLFLDEIGELRPSHQSSLLRFLETGTYRSVGSDTMARADVRVITATHKDLREEIARERFRLDLYYRLSQLTFSLPPLRDRKVDIPLLIEQFGAKTPPPELLTQLLSLPFEGNVRELKNLCQVARQFGWPKTKSLFASTWRSPTEVEPEMESSLYSTIQQRALKKAIEETGGNISAAARLLGIPRSTLINKLKRVGMR